MFSKFFKINNPFENQWIFYRTHEFSLKSVSNRQKSLQKIKYYVTCIFHTLLILQNIVLIIDNNADHLYYFGFFHFFGGIPKFIYFMVISSSVLCLSSLIILNNSRNHKWLEIIDAIIGLKTFQSIGLSDRKLINEFKSRIKLVRKAFDVIYIFDVIMVILTTLSVHIIFFDFNSDLLYGLIGGLIFFTSSVSFLSIFLYGFHYYLIVCYYCQLRVKAFNNRMLSKVKHFEFIRNKTVINLLKNHNNIVLDIELYNKFWSQYNRAVYLSLAPIQLMGIQQILFDKIDLFPSLLLGSFVAFSLVFVLLANLSASAINIESYKTHKILYKFFIENNSSLNNRLKFKVKSFKIEFKNLINFSVD